MRAKAGFTLMEALIALAIAAIALTAVFGLQYQLVNGQQRFERTLEQAELRRSALALLRDMNPDETPEGEIALPPGHTVRWVAEPLTEPVITSFPPATQGAFLATLYRVDVEVSGPEGVVDTFSVERLGYALPVS